jgi:hypothetical protein
MRAQPASLENVVRKAVTMAHTGRRGLPPTSDPVRHKITIPPQGKYRRSQTFECEFVGGGVGRVSLVVITLDGFEVLRATLGPDFKNNPDRLKVENIAKLPADWRELFMAMPLFVAGAASDSR